MAEKNLTIYIANNVGMDYFFSLGKTLTNAGFSVKPIFLTTEMTYRKLSRSGGIKKVWLRIQMYLLYPCKVLYRALVCSRNSLFIITSGTFFMPLLCSYVLRPRGIKVIHTLYDLFPDALEHTELKHHKKNGLIAAFMAGVIRKTLKKCEATVFLGPFLKFHAEHRWAKPKISKSIDISVDISQYKKFQAHDVNEKLIIHYGGQLGNLHDAVSIIESVKHVCNSDIGHRVEFNFYVSGAKAELLEKELSGYPVKISAAIQSAQWRDDIRNFHIGLVSLKQSGATVCMPSKTYGMMAGGLAILAICPVWSDLATLVKTSDAGWVINNSPFSKVRELMEGEYLENIDMSRDETSIVTEFYSTIKSILNNRAMLEHKRSNAYQQVRLKYGMEILSEEWKEVIEQVNGDTEPASTHYLKPHLKKSA